MDMTALAKAVSAVIQNCADESLCNEFLSVKLTIEECALTDTACIITIEDNGQGIRPLILPRIFNPFFSTKTGHAGMGLTLAQRIMQESGGRIKIDSEFGQGTVVTIHVPKCRRRKIRTQKL